MSAHSKAMAIAVAAICDQLPGHAVLLIISGEDCGSDVVANIPPFEQAQLLETALKAILTAKDTLQ